MYSLDKKYSCLSKNKEAKVISLFAKVVIFNYIIFHVLKYKERNSINNYKFQKLKTFILKKKV